MKVLNPRCRQALTFKETADVALRTLLLSKKVEVVYGEN